MIAFFVKIRHQSNTIILYVGTKYSVRDLLCDVINKKKPDLQSNDMRHIRQMISVLPLASARLSKL